MHDHLIVVLAGLQVLDHVLLFLVLLLDVVVELSDIVFELLFDIAQLLKLFLKLLDTLACTLVVLSDSDGLLSFFHELFFLLLDLGSKILLAAVQLLQLRLHLLVLVVSFLNELSVALDLLLELGNGVLLFPDHGLQLVALLLLSLGEGRRLLLLLVLELHRLRRQLVVALVDDRSVLLDSFKLLFHHAQLVLMVSLLLLGLLKAERLV